MALTLKDRVLETASAPGTGAVTLLGAVTGYQTFSAAVGNGNTCYYTIADQSGANWECGIGTYASSGNTLTRTTVLSSSNAGSTVNFASGTQNVFVTYPSEKAVYLDASGNVQPSLGTATFSSITDSGLTSGRVTYSGTGGLLQDSANLTFNGTTLTANTLNLTNALGVSYGGTGLTTLTSGYIPYGNGTSAFSSSSSLYFDGANLGVGTTSPYSNAAFSTLTLGGSGSARTGLIALVTAAGTDSAHIDVYNTQLRISTNGTTNPIVFYTGGSVTEAMRLTSAGYVGIGDNNSQVGLSIVKYGTAWSTSANIYTFPAGKVFEVMSGVSAADNWFGIIGNYGQTTGSANLLLQSSVHNTSEQAGNYIGSETQSAFRSDLTFGYLTAGSTTGTNGTKTELMRLTPSGYLGIGTSSPSALLSVIDASNTLNYQLILGSTGSQNYNIGRVSSSGALQFYGNQSGVTSFVFGGVDGERMRIDSSGNLLVGTTSSSTQVKGFVVNNASTPFVSVCGPDNTSATSTYYVYSTNAAAYRFYVDYGGTVHATSTSIVAISDQSLKTNVKPLETGLNEVMRLQPRRFDWTEESKNEARNVAGFIAQEVQEVLPDLVGDFKYSDTETKLGLKMGDMIPTLVKAIQDQQALIESLTAEVNQLKQN